MNPDDEIPSPSDILGLFRSNLPERDLENLKFILNLGPEAAVQWFQTLDPDNAEYAIQLIQSCTSELEERIQALDDDEDLDLTEANLVINRIKGKL